MRLPKRMSPGCTSIPAHAHRFRFIDTSHLRHAECFRLRGRGQALKALEVSHRQNLLRFPPHSRVEKTRTLTSASEFGSGRCAATDVLAAEVRFARTGRAATLAVAVRRGLSRRRDASKGVGQRESAISPR